MELEQLKTLLAVLEAGSFSRAAEALEVAQSTVSFHVKALEKSAGARLLDRQGGGVRATTAGKVLERYGKRILSMHDEALARLRDESALAAGNVTVAASSIPEAHLLPPAIAALRRAHPHVTVRVSPSDSQRAIGELLAHACDFAVVGVKPTDRRVVATAIADDEIVLCGPTSGPLAELGKLDLDELRRLPLIVREEGSGTRRAVEPLLGGVVPAVQVGSLEAVRRCVQAGLGVSFVSRLALLDDLRDKRLRVLKLAGTPVERAFYVARLRSSSLSPAASWLVRALSQHAAHRKTR